jgi:hypothetical protein
MIDTDTVLIIAGRSNTDPRSVRKVLAGERMRGQAAERIHKVLAELGYSSGQQFEGPASPFGVSAGAQSITSVGWHGMGTGGPR